MKNFAVRPVSMVDYNDMQRVFIDAVGEKPVHGSLAAYGLEDGKEIARAPVAFITGHISQYVSLPVRREDTPVRWQVEDEDGTVLASCEDVWKKPREWKIYIMISSHTDIGLHNSQYIQRRNSVLFAEKAMALCDETQNRPEKDRYRYVLEGTWVFDNYPGDRGREAACRLVRDYIQPGKMGVCAGVAGNHTQSYGLEEMCRSAYGRKRLKDTWDIDCRTISMIDNNGMTWGMVQPYAEAGYENIIFAPNQWNPRPSTVWKMDESVSGMYWNINAGGGGSRLEARYGSGNPRVFFWEAAEGGKRMLVWIGGTYSHSVIESFGFSAYSHLNSDLLPQMEGRIAGHLPVMEEYLPYDVWMQACYLDDQEPDIKLTDVLAGWNKKWKWPAFRTVGNPDVPFDELKSRFAGQIPVLRGDITGGWYQHPVAAPDFLSDKRQAERALPAAEKYSTIAALIDPEYAYPAEKFDRAWEALIFHDEHSYGTSGYQGRRVYETWLQHRDWIDKAAAAAREETGRALHAIASQISAEEASVVAFNPLGRARTETIRRGNEFVRAELPPMGYTRIPLSDFREEACAGRDCILPPTVENEYYLVAFDECGGMKSVWDKQLQRELLNTEAGYPANCFLYTRDNHATFVRPGKAEYTVREDIDGILVTARMEETDSGAEVIQQVRLCAHEKRIDIDNRINHIHGLYNRCRYDRYIYYAFPFAVDGARRLCHLNGCEAEYAKDVTGHGTDVYMAASDWCCAENGSFGVGVIQLDSELVEFDHIHPDKTDWGAAGAGSEMYFYLANDWLQMHSTGGSHMNLRFRYAITSYEGDHRAAGLDSLADRVINQPETVEIPPQTGRFAEKTRSFAACVGDTRLLNIKRAQDGNGVIVRLYGAEDGQVRLDRTLFGDRAPAPAAADESGLNGPSRGRGFHTLRVPGLIMRTCGADAPHAPGAANTPIGAVYTGLVTAPRAVHGENEGHLYLLWGSTMEEDLSHYELYRSMESGFVPGEDSFAARIEPEDYRVGRYVDEGLERHARYFYRVRAVDREGRPGPFSEEFSAVTREGYREE